MEPDFDKDPKNWVYPYTNDEITNYVETELRKRFRHQFIPEDILYPQAFRKKLFKHFTCIVDEDLEGVADIEHQLGGYFYVTFVHDYRFLRLDLQGSLDCVIREKAQRIGNEYLTLPCPVIVDAISVGFNALGGLPGTLITSFCNKLTSGELYRLLEGFDDKSAFVQYAMCCIEQNKEPYFHKGTLYGTVVKPKNPYRYGWKSCFQPDAYDKTYDEIPKLELFKISARKAALRTLIPLYYFKGDASTDFQLPTLKKFLSEDEFTEITEDTKEKKKKLEIVNVSINTFCDTPLTYTLHYDKFNPVTMDEHLPLHKHIPMYPSF